MGLTDRRGLQHRQTVTDALIAGGRLTLRVGPKGDIAAAGPAPEPEDAQDSPDRAATDTAADSGAGPPAE